MRKSIPLVIVGLFLVVIGLCGAIVSIFMAQNAVGNLVLSPYIALALFLVIMLVGDALFILYIQKDKEDETIAKLGMISSIEWFTKVYFKEHGYMPSKQTINEVIEFTLKEKDNKKGKV